ncbi:anaerobic ribonucleotide reductase-activating protein [Slackia heliotrinireducens]|uniref:Pyruvate-formate lyase-activating enzyme n=1 Tax=Slackia heliotrinireducens (strain ATCC 29202 / DSM 20476 / NCTC 11029 / RHS 1) TaxID=471855 RepID=C7N6I0_SLAHD|nr:4Fe-4S single cluster domain-containing protein [Slackia heliotrinireducens]ACV22515.1 pyruvate-formate lyase-activating enzyme [Slackia heliotrinireducens DSM 20476]VEH00945.1 anaerobic ribonucleotide reductase-activating protein [Slackia heliotrinireducens]
MFVDRVINNIETLGPGSRIVVWTVGCSKRCPGCANPELWEASDANRIDNDQLAEALVRMAKASGTRAITFTGGDPLEQPDDLAWVLRSIRPAFDDVLVYTGYVAEDVQDLLDSEFDGLIDVLIDGPYVESLNDGVCALRGSTNQRVMVLNPVLQAAYDDALSEPRRVQNLYFDNRAMSVGIHKVAQRIHGDCPTMGTNAQA